MPVSEAAHHSPAVIAYADVVSDTHVDHWALQNESETQRELIIGAVRGDSDALSKLLERQAPALRQALSADNTWLSHLELADVLQVTYLEAVLHIRRFDPQRSDSLGAWLLKIARNNLRRASSRSSPTAMIFASIGS